MKKVTFAILGMGNRGNAYARKQEKFPQDMEVVAIADTRQICLDAANKYLRLPEDRIFHSADELLNQPRLADIMIIATQDAQHKEHALRAMERGYDLLLEKPISNKLSDCVEIAQAAKRLGRMVIICHVLRYTVFYQQIKKLLDEGFVGKIESIQAAECVGYYHIAHSFVRGNWHKEADSSPMILAKCCHDMDILLWLTGKNCRKVTSFGSLDYFTRENRPEEATERCTDGCAVDCPFHAPRFYLSTIPGWPANVLHPEPTEENIMESLRTTDYGKCVFQMDNDVVDHQVVNMLMEDGSTINFQMVGFTNDQTRTIRIMGTKGEIWGDMQTQKLYYQQFNKPRQELDLNALCEDFSGHGGGDSRLIHDVIRYWRGDDFDTSAITTIERSVQSHYLAFAAEQSRLEDGKTVDFDAFVRELEGVAQ